MYLKDLIKILRGSAEGAGVVRVYILMLFTNLLNGVGLFRGEGGVWVAC